MPNDFGDDTGEKLVDWMIRIGQDAGEAAMVASGEKLAAAFRRARDDCDDVDSGRQPSSDEIRHWAMLDLREFTGLPEYETIRQIIDDRLSHEGIRHEFAPLPEGEHLVFLVEDAPDVNEVFKKLEETARDATERAGSELSRMRERVREEPIAEKAKAAKEAAARIEAAKGKSREISRGVEMRAK